MLLAQTVATGAYLAFVARIWLLMRHPSPSTRAGLRGAALPLEDQAPESAVGWPPAGDEFRPYVEDGMAALGSYLANGLAP